MICFRYNSKSVDVQIKCFSDFAHFGWGDRHLNVQMLRLCVDAQICQKGILSARSLLCKMIWVFDLLISNWKRVTWVCMNPSGRFSSFESVVPVIRNCSVIGTKKKLALSTQPMRCKTNGDLATLVFPRLVLVTCIARSKCFASCSYWFIFLLAFRVSDVLASRNSNENRSGLFSTLK